MKPGANAGGERYFEDFAIGQTYRSSAVRIDADQIKRFAAEFDPQPFHLDEDAARATLFAGLAASGWHTAALTMKLCVQSDFRPAGGMVGLAFQGRWPKAVRPGDELHVEIEVTNVRSSNSNSSRGVLTVSAATLNQRGEAVQLSTFTVLVPCRP